MLSASLTGRLGGLVMTGFPGVDIDDDTLSQLKNLAGAILFKHNLRSAAQTRSLTDALRELHQEELGPLIAIDQEGGTVSRLADFGTTTPSAMALGAIADETVTQAMYGIIGQELAALGVSWDFAPVADVNSNPQNPVRSFGSRPAEVAAHVNAAVRGLHGAGVAATAKHFPGHGDTFVDSHVGLPALDHGIDRLREFELVPFAAAIAGGVDAIMTAHITLRAIDAAAVPATLSRALLTGVLREELGFDGVVCTDCMEMDAIAATYSAEEAAVMAVAAGADLVLFSHGADKARRAVDGLERALQDGRVTGEQVDRSLARVDALRARCSAQQRLAGDRRAAHLDGLTAVGGAAHQSAALEAARKAITLIRDPNGLLPLRFEAGDRVFVVRFCSGGHTPVEDKAARHQTVIGKALAAAGARVQEQVRTFDPAGHEYKQLLMAAGSAQSIIAITARVRQHPLQARAVGDLALLGKPLIAIAAREPYDASMLPGSATVVASYGDDPLALQAASEALLGVIRTRGKLPVEVA